MMSVGLFTAGAAAALSRARAVAARVRIGGARGAYSLAGLRTLDEPIVMTAKVVEGFGRGGKLLGCPTANLEADAVDATLEKVETGVYFGWAKLRGETYPMVTSIGWNPYFKNDKKTVEPHLLHKFESDFYGETISLAVCGYLRPELDFESMEKLIEWIENDKKAAVEALASGAHDKFKAALP